MGMQGELKNRAFGLSKEIIADSKWKYTTDSFIFHLQIF